MRKILLLTLLGLPLLSTVWGQDQGPGAPLKSGVPAAPGRRSPFRYVIFQKTLMNGGDETVDRKEATHRILGVLVDSAAFSESNLRTLFRLLAKRLPTPELMMVHVYTSLEQTETPEESDFGVSGTEPPRGFYNHHHAYMERAKNQELIRYSTSLPSTRLKTVYLKGGPTEEQKE